MKHDKKVSLAKEVVTAISSQGVSVEDFYSICDIAKKIAAKTTVSETCVDAFDGWID